ncbi:hypothetical protein RAB80_014441 [Fusarium oxysporum f. sp. vasinfectum]|nr:hypothetical protein RAB80_014441 [Fusarium oxysporum f. sp. vasinfectum]
MVDENGIRQSQKRRKKFAQLKKHLRRTRPGPLLHLATQFVRKFIPGTADPIQRIKEVFFEFRNEDKVLETISREAGNKTRYTSAESNAAAALESICDSIQDNINSGADSTKQFHLATDASENGTRGVLQLDDTSAGEDSTEKDFKNAGVIMWISGALQRSRPPIHDAGKGNACSRARITRKPLDDQTRLAPGEICTDRKGMTNSMVNRGPFHGKATR